MEKAKTCSCCFLQFLKGACLPLRAVDDKEDPFVQVFWSRYNKFLHRHLGG